jgi:hypothetical protein
MADPVVIEIESETGKRFEWTRAPDQPGAVKASETQIGGDHYKNMGDYQPWDVLRHWLTPEEYRGYQKGVAIAYLARERQKGSDQDIAKAMHHLQKLVEVLGEAGDGKGVVHG